jgi:hypothetical protein
MYFAFCAEVADADADADPSLPCCGIVMPDRDAL